MTEPVADPGPTSFLDSLGTRGLRRAEPRTSIAIAAAGCALAVLGALIVAGDTGAGDGGDFNRIPGILLSALVVVAGYAALANAERGAVATGGTVAAALGVPALMVFLTLDVNDFPPYSSEGILIVSSLAWLASYAVGPGRGRPFFLGAGLIGVWLTVLQLVENVFDAPFNALGFASQSFESTSTFDDGTIVTGGDAFGNGPSFDAPDPATIGILSLLFGVGFLLATRWLDRNGRHGVATPFTVAALPCLYVGVTGLAPDLEAAGSGLLLVLIGLGLAYHGATVWRRFTTWLGGATTAFGAAVFLSDMTDDATVGGMLFIAAGIALVFAGHAIATAISEPDEMTVTVPLVAATVTAPASPPPAPPPAPDDSQWAPPAEAPPIPPPPGAPGAPDDDRPPPPL